MSAKSGNRTPLFEFALPTELRRQIDAWRRQQEDIVSRAEAIRRLCELGLVHSSVVGRSNSGADGRGR